MNLKYLFLLLFSICHMWQDKVRAQCNNVVGDTVYVTTTNNVGESLSTAIECVNDPGNSIRFIHFDVDEPGVITFTPTGTVPLPTITKNNVVIDARTEPGWFLGKIVIDGSVFSSTMNAINIQSNNVSVYGLTITGFTNTSTGAAIYLQGNDALIEQNALIGNRYGINTASPSVFTARNNSIGVDPVSDAADGNSVAGINILTSALGAFEISNNTIAYNPTGILAASSLVEVLASENSMYCNSIKGIERSGFSVSGFAINIATTSSVSGTAPNGALVEVFIHNNASCTGFTAPCQGKTYLGTVTATGGNWTLSLSPGIVLAGDEITATATLGGNNTSEFLSCLTATCPPANISFSNVQDACGATSSGSATASVSIPGSFTYEWSDGQTDATAISLAANDYTVTATGAAGCAYSGNITIDAQALPSANPFGSTPLCIGETLLLEANTNGGSPPYNYNWNGPNGYMSDEEDPIITDIQVSGSGTYTLLVTDNNGCEDTESTFVEVNEGPDFDLNAIDISCNGAADGSIDLTPITIIPPITYEWSNTANTEDIENLSQGTYFVTVTDGNGCVSSDSQVINEPPVLLLTNLQSSPPTMLGGNDATLSFDIDGGTAPYTYSWSGPVNGSNNQASTGTANINDLLAGDYTLVLTDDSGCTTNQTFSISDFDCGFSIVANSVIPISCAGEMDGQIDISLSDGAEPITFNWDNGATSEDINGLGVGTYALTATDASGCTVFFSATIMAPPPLVINNTQANPPSTLGGNDGFFSFNINGGTAPYSYSWTGPINGSDNLASPGNVIINNLPAGDYNLILTDDNGCNLTQAFIINSLNCNLSITDETISDESCAGEMDGSISLIVSGGTPPYNYSWTNGGNSDNGSGTAIVDLVGAIYDITITDQDNCVATTSLTVGTNSLPSPGSTTSSNCDEGNGTATFDLSALEGTITPNPNLAIAWFEDPAGTMLISDPATYTSLGQTVYAATNAGNCFSSLVGTELIVLPPNDPNCMPGDCTTFAGTFSNDETQTVCNSFSAADFYNNDAILEANDTLVFVLHTLAGENLGTVLTIAPTPTAIFDADNMVYGVTYYLSAVAGNNSGSSIDLNDPCLSIAAGQAVVFSDNLSGVLNFIQGEEVLCQSEDLFLSTNVLTGFDLAYYWIQPSGDTVITTTANLLLENIQPLDAGDYYVFVQDESCLFDQTGPFTLAVLGLAPGELIEAGNDTIICDHQFTLNAAPISNGNGFWTGPSEVMINDVNSASTSVSLLNDGANLFIWTVNTPDCGTIGSDTLTITVADGLLAEDDSFTLAQANSEIFMDVLKNDGLADQTDFTLQALTQPEFGNLLTLDNGFQYFEPGGQRGVVSFVYEICYTNGNCANSCATATVTIDVLNLPYLPEGFTPNNDGKNDQLQVLGYSGGGDISMKIQITNRWGDIVYSSDNYLLETPWDGRMNNKKETLAEGTYYAWIEITVDGVVYQQSQALYLIE